MQGTSSASGKAPSFDTELTKHRATKGFIERFWDNLAKSGKEKMTPSFLRLRLELLDGYWHKFEEGHFNLLGLDDGSASDLDLDEMFADTETAYIDVKARIWDSLQETTSVPIPPSAGAASAKVSALPRLSLPKFSGDQLAWEGFRDLFCSLVHDVPGVSPVEKLQYLQSCLVGEAAACVSNCELSEAGYLAAWDELIAQYDNRRVILSAHMRALLSCPSVIKATAADIKRLVTTVNQAVRSFRSMKRPVDQWDDWFVHILVDKLDSASRLLWEASLENSTDFPTLKQLLDFLQTRIRSLDASGATSVGTRPRASSPPRTNRGRAVSALTTSTPNVGAGKCTLCQGAHAFNYCSRFRAMTVGQRRDLVRRKGVCYNCFKQGHDATHCPSPHCCQTCQKRHHTFLHQPSVTGGRPPATGAGQRQPVSSDTATPTNVNALATATIDSPLRPVLLATACVTLQGPDGQQLTVRALLDSGSEASFLSARVARGLGLRRHRVHVPITGLQGSAAGTASEAVSVTLTSQGAPAWSEEIPQLYVLNKLTARVASSPTAHLEWPHLQGIPLADPSPRTPTPVEAILGAPVYGRVLRGGVIQGPPGSPSAHLTVFGWVLMGDSPTTPATSSPSSGVAALHVVAGADLDRELQRFWEMEEVSVAHIRTPEDARCEELFRTTHQRDESGRYVVRLPMRDDVPLTLGESRGPCVRMLLSQEARASRNGLLQQRYSEFLADYLRQGHMLPAPAPPSRSETASYLPHHPFFKKGDSSGKIRVVFNGSFRTSTGRSLNDLLLPGPRLQTDLWIVITRWRLFRFAFTTDIVQMFRQVRVHPADLDLQRIVWREERDGPVKDYQLATVTYGTAPAPYLALRTLLQLAEDERSSFPLGAGVIEANSYVDDLLAGADSLPQATDVREQLIRILMAGGFALSKWAANDALLGADGVHELLHDDLEASVCTLGVWWNTASDTLHLRPAAVLSDGAGSSKRAVLSDVARFFDPLGWAAPALVYGKIFIQELWMTGISWDEPLPPAQQTSWKQFAGSLSSLKDVSVPRWAHYTAGCDAELHGFSDASSRAYAAAVYLRTTDVTGNVVVTLLVAKTKVAPVKTVSIPRLELCGAALLARLLTAVTKGLGLTTVPLTAWTDAEVVLAWISSHASRWKPFVANRVAAIQDLVPPSQWRHVPTADNPADAATRGIPASELPGMTQWWAGPSWLASSPEHWPRPKISTPSAAREEERAVVVLKADTQEDFDLVCRYSSLSRLLRISALCLRFAYNCRNRGQKRLGFLTFAELDACLLHWVRVSQLMEFPADLDLLSRRQPLPKSSRLLPLRPLVDQEGLLRVGGRLRHSQLSYNEQCPLIMGKGNHLTLLLVRDAHERSLHGGQALTRNLLARRFWILSAGSVTRSVIHRCVRCARFRSVAASQQMGQLPAAQTHRARPFQTSGVDYAGPIRLRTTKGRGNKSYKGYICLFVCLASRAIHLEVVSDLTSASFLAAFRRFVSRRGPCRRLLSDNGTNFRGADSELRAMFRSASTFYQEAGASLANDGTEWEFIPPAAPHFGGLWEAGVKSVKTHLKRAVGDSTLTFEELTTLLCQVEACLNSRPLAPLSNDATDLSALTPGHLLVGEPLVAVPEPSQADLAASHPLSRWALLSRMRDQFWRRWSVEYLHHLQQLPKWRCTADNVGVGELVLVRSELSPPTKWPLARITALHPGSDGLVRVVTLTTASGTFKRPITKICRLPVDTELVPSGPA